MGCVSSAATTLAPGDISSTAAPSVTNTARSRYSRWQRASWGGVKLWRRSVWPRAAEPGPGNENRDARTKLPGAWANTALDEVSRASAIDISAGALDSRADASRVQAGSHP